MRLIKKIIFIFTLINLFVISLFCQTEKKSICIVPFYFLSDIPTDVQDKLFTLIEKKVVEEKGYNIIQKDNVIKYFNGNNIPLSDILFDEDLFKILKGLNCDYVMFNIVNSDRNNNITIFSKILDKDGKKNLWEDQNILNYNHEITDTNSKPLNTHLKNLFSNTSNVVSEMKNLLKESTDASVDLVFYSKTESSKIAFIPSYNLSADIEEKKVDELSLFFVDEISKNIQFRLQDRSYIRDILSKNKINNDLVLVNDELREILSKSKSDMLIYTLIHKNKKGNIEFYTKIINKLGKIQVFINELGENDSDNSMFSIESKRIAGLTVKEMFDKMSAQPILLDYRFTIDFVNSPKLINFSPFFEYIDKTVTITKNKIKMRSTYEDKLVKDDRFVSIISFDSKALVTVAENKTIYLMDVVSGKVEKEYQDKNIINISTPAILYNDGVLFANEKKLYYFKEIRDKIFKKVTADRITLNLDSSSGFWALPVVYKNLALIPTSNMVMAFDGTKLEPLEIYGLLGQTLLTLEGDDLYVLDSFGVKIYKYNLKTNKVVWSSEQIQDITVFSPAEVSDNIVVFSDIQNKIYLFD
ncbi:MAG TPA: hypothetical protein PK771_08430, partial [Spirochaetota bacterium]|nr:hypothetical protein [Spirochaetota bacterium]